MELNPKYAQAVAWYALYVVSMIDGQFDEGVALMTPIVQQDPLSGYSRAVRAWLLAFDGRYDEGIAESLAAIELDPESLVTHYVLQSAYTLAGRFPEALAAGHAALKGFARHPLAMSFMGVTYADCGKRTEARALHDELMKRAESGWVSPCLRAQTAATAGLTDEVVTLVARGIEERDPYLILMGAYPPAERLHRVLREAGKLEEVRRQLGIPSND